MSRPRILIVDNHDSFTWNLVQFLRELGAIVEVRLNDAVTTGLAVGGGFDGIVVSPGPGRPARAGVTPSLVRATGPIPLLGVCLGHQAIGEAWGGRIVRARRLMHGKTSLVRHDGRGVFAGLPNPFEAARYHSLVVDRRSIPPELEVTALSEDHGEDVVMGLRHRDYPRTPVEGVQFHPESVLTADGMRLLSNFLDRTLAARARRFAASTAAGRGRSA